MNFAEVAEVAFLNGPAWSKPWAAFMKHFINYGLFITYFGTCSVYTVIIAENFKQIIEHYTGWDVDVRAFIAAMLIPLILLSWVPNLKYLAPFSSVANVFMAVGLLITFYYCTTDMPPISERKMHTSFVQIAPFFGIGPFSNFYLHHNQHILIIYVTMNFTYLFILFSFDNSDFRNGSYWSG